MLKRIALLWVLGISCAFAQVRLEAPATAKVGSELSITVSGGPINERDFISIVPKGSREGLYNDYKYTPKPGVFKPNAPPEPGEYEIRLLGAATPYPTLARRPLVLESVAVTLDAPAQVNAGAKFEVEWTGPNNQRDYVGIGTADVTKRPYITYVYTSKGSPISLTIPAGTPFALRVFGRELDSCQTDLMIPLGALNASAVAAKIATLEAKNNAKTPIGASLGQVANDLSAAKGERLVVLLTDGEETCGGDPAAAITKLKQSGVAVRVNIVGFAIDDATLATTFKHWADTGGGMFFDAKDAAGLDKALSQAMRSGFEIVNAQGQAVAEGLAGGEPVRVMPGSYSVRIKGQSNPAQPVTVRPKETAAVKF